VPAVGAGLEAGVGYSTVDLHVQFVGAVTNEDVVAEGWITRRGRSVVFCESEAYGMTTGRRIAKSVLTYNIATR
jgi:acyl-coenzyme A thioesterase PaaI-like protein